MRSHPEVSIHQESCLTQGDKFERYISTTPYAPRLFGREFTFRVEFPLLFDHAMDEVEIDTR